MFKFWYEKMTTRFLFPLIFISLFAIFGYAQYLESLLPPIEEKVAPFPISEVVKDDDLFDTPEAIEQPLNMPHRTASQIQEWISTAASEALTFEGQDYDQVLENVRDYFTAAGFNQYKTYLESIQLRENLIRSNYRAGIFFDQAPYIGKGSAFEGVYRWQARMPLTLSFSSRNDGNIVNRNLLVDVQITRAERDGDKNLILIEGWDVKSRRE